MKLRELESLLQDVKPFSAPKIALEQYPTSPHIASRMLYTVNSIHDDFEGKVVLDLGCGTGMLSIGAALLGSSYVVGVDVDPDALEVAQDNIDEFEGELPIELLACDATSASTALARLRADTVVMNPPFGTRSKGADVEFLRVAFRIATRSVISLHKTSTRTHIQQVAQRELGAVSAEVVAQLRYDLPATYKFHKQRSVDVDVDVWRFQIRQ